MKTLLLFFIAGVFASLTGRAQVSESINYQAVARNSAGAALSNQTIKVRFTISRNAVLLYSETRQVTTNILGLFNIQIGSPGAITTSGSFTGIDWTNNTPNMQLKVELDVNNSGVFTDMGFQAFSSVPFAMASKKAVEAENTLQIAGRPLDMAATPSVGSRLSWDGTNWTPIKKDTVYNVNYTGKTTILPSANWTFLNGSNSTFTLTGKERINMNLSSAVLYTGTAINNFQLAVCYQLADLSGPVTPITVFATVVSAMPGDGNSGRNTGVSSSGAISLPAGDYIFGLAIKGHTDAFSSSARTNGTIEIKY